MEQGDRTGPVPDGDCRAEHQGRWTRAATVMRPPQQGRQTGRRHPGVAELAAAFEDVARRT